MEFAIFDFLEGLSPWWWVAGALALGALEMATMSFFLIWLGLAALIMSVVLVVFPAMPGEVQVAAFAILSVALTFVGRSYVKHFGDGEAETTLNSRASRLVGRTGKVIRFNHGEGVIEIGGVQWQAKGDPDAIGMSPGATVRVTQAEGMTLTVESGLAG